MTLEAFLLEMAGLVPYEKRTVKGHIAREDMARKLLLNLKSVESSVIRGRDLQDCPYCRRADSKLQGNDR